MDKFRIADSLENVLDIYRRCNKYIDETMPWVLAKDEAKKDRLATVLYNIVESVRIATVYLSCYCICVIYHNNLKFQILIRIL